MSATSITPGLQASARSAYRNLWRAASSTFAGDAHILQAWRHKMRADAVAARANTEADAYSESIKLSKDIANILRQNIAQIQRVPGEEDVWKLRLTEHSELGDNESVKQPKPIDIGPKGKRRTKQVQLDLDDLNFSPLPSSVLSPVVTASPNTVESTTTDSICSENESLITNPNDAGNARPKPIFYSQMKKLAKERVLPELKEEDLEEVFVRGHGPGGQSINKTNNNVQLIHRPTGIRVVCQQTRSLALNRMYARRILLEKLDRIANPGLSKGEMQRAKQIERERRRRKKAKQERDEEDRAARKKKNKEEKQRQRREAQLQEEDEDD